MRDLAEAIDSVCALTTSAETLNTLHGARPGHPGGDPAYRYRNAFFAARRVPGAPLEAMRALYAAAAQEGGWPQ